jgi:hypothetical protein
LIADIDFAALAIVDAIDKPADIVLIATHGIPPVIGNAATDFAFAIAVFAIILAIAAACSITIPAIATFLFLPAIC